MHEPRRTPCCDQSENPWHPSTLVPSPSVCAGLPKTGNAYAMMFHVANKCLQLGKYQWNMQLWIRRAVSNSLVTDLHSRMLPSILRRRECDRVRGNVNAEVPAILSTRTRTKLRTWGSRLHAASRWVTRGNWKPDCQDPNANFSGLATRANCQPSYRH